MPERSVSASRVKREGQRFCYSHNQSRRSGMAFATIQTIVLQPGISLIVIESSVTVSRSAIFRLAESAQGVLDYHE